MIGCLVKTFHGVKLMVLKFCTKKSNCAKGWCAQGLVQSLSDFDGLDTTRKRPFSGGFFRIPYKNSQKSVCSGGH